MTERTLVLLRHAKAEQPHGLADFDRPLSARGHADAAAAGAWLARQALVPELTLCSPAKRTRQTWHGVAVALADAASSTGGPTVRYEPALYSGGWRQLVDLVRQAGGEVGTVLVIGHNPTVSEVSATLAEGAAGGDGGGGPVGLRTCGLAVHRLAGPWSGCGPGSAPLTRTHTARG